MEERGTLTRILTKNVTLGIVVEEFSFIEEPVLRLNFKVKGIEEKTALSLLPSVEDIARIYNVIPADTYPLTIIQILRELDEMNKDGLRKVLKTILDLWYDNLRKAIEEGKIIAGGIEYKVPLTPEHEEINVEAMTPLLVIGDTIYELAVKDKKSFSEYMKIPATGSIAALKGKIRELEEKLKEENFLPLNASQLKKLVEEGYFLFFFLNPYGEIELGITRLDLKFKVSKIIFDDEAYEIPEEVKENLPELLPVITISKSNIVPRIIKVDTFRVDTDHPNVDEENENACLNTDISGDLNNIEADLLTIRERLVTINMTSSYHDLRGPYEEILEADLVSMWDLRFETDEEDGDEE